ncbi:oxygenase MpaB family protein [Kitasatospora sp. NPDC001175]|uniref:oxygenase MpaB family protein n=1 Tax=Kitasatospora sp. NPDC001175 TaxID=3157103 RepID=UPI003D031679
MITRSVPRDPDAPDPGLFGPSSVTWHLHADPAMWIGGISALHLQALHPVAALGIVQNSSFEDDPFGRLTGTGSFIVATTWGTREQAERAGARVRLVHERLRIRDPETGAVHRVDAPDLLLWVHCALVRSNLHAVLRGGLDLSARQADRYVREQRQVAALMGLASGDAPGSVADLEDYLCGMRPVLAATAEAMAIHRFVARPPLHGLHRSMRPAWTVASRLGYSLMPSWARESYGQPGIPAPVANTALRAVRSAAFLIPRAKRLDFPVPVLSQAVARLGKSSIPSGRRLSEQTRRP